MYPVASVMSITKVEVLQYHCLLDGGASDSVSVGCEESGGKVRDAPDRHAPRNVRLQDLTPFFRWLDFQDSC